MAELQSFDNMPELEPVHPRVKVLEEDWNSNLLPKEKSKVVVEEKDSISVGRNDCINQIPVTHNNEGAGLPAGDLNFSNESCHGNSSTFSQLPPQQGKMENEAVSLYQKATTAEESEQESGNHAEDFGARGRMLAAEGIKIDMLAWMTFYTDDFPPSTLQDEAKKFLVNCLPSKVKRSYGVGWISVVAPGDDELSSSDDDDGDDDEEEKNVRGLTDAWAKLNKSGEEINIQKIQQLALAHGTLCGKWMVFRKKGIHTDLTWERIFRATIVNRLGISAKVSTFEEDEPRHVICVYNKNFTDKAEVRELESRLRAIGILCTMQYKPDVFTYLGVYRGNEWSLKPVMYVSNFDLRKNSSTIVSNYDGV